MTVHLTAESVSDATIGWRVGPGLIRSSGPVPAGEAPAPLRALFDDGVLAAVEVAPGSIRTTLGPGRSAAVDGPSVRSALYEVLAAEGGWPSGGTTTVAQAADREIATAVADVLAGEFGAYTATHGGRVNLVDVSDGVVCVELGGHCHGCPAADATLKNNLAVRLAGIPGFRGLAVAGRAR